MFDIDTYNLSDDQKHAFDVLTSGQNAFVFGDAGCGKSYLLQTFLDWAEDATKSLLVCAPTGIAATNLGGATLHATFDAPTSPIMPIDDVDTTPAVELLGYVDTIIIDEISMCRIDLFQFVVSKILNQNHANARMGLPPIQLIVVGDFYQLPPVITRDDAKAMKEMYGQARFAFESPRWNDMGFAPLHLTCAHRQDDSEFISMLKCAQHADLSCIPYFNDHCQDKTLRRKDVVALFPTNAKVRKHNTERLAKQKGRTRTYQAKISGDIREGDFAVDATLKLKCGCPIIMLNNDADGRWVNGDTAIVEKLEAHYIWATLTSGQNEGEYVMIKRKTFERIYYELKNVQDIAETDDDDDSPKPRGKKRIVEHIVGSIRQFPVKLAYALTIHKSQGQTYDAVLVDPDVFDAGQLYVALSRARNIENLATVGPILPAKLRVNPKVYQFMDYLETGTVRN